MIQKNPDEFKISFSENNGMDDESVVREEILRQRLEKLSKRITLLSILIPVLIGVVFTFAYLDIKKRIYSMQDTGMGELQRLSRDLESRFSSLSVRFAKYEDSFEERENSLKGIEESFSKKNASVEKTLSMVDTSINDMKKIIKETENKIGEILATQSNHIEKKEFEILEKSLADAQKDMLTVLSQMKELDGNFKNELKLLTDYLAKQKKRLDNIENLTGNFSEDMINIRSEFKELSKKTEGFVRAEDMPLAVEKARLSLKVAVDEAVMKMQNRLDALERQLALLSSQPDAVLERNIQ